MNELKFELSFPQGKDIVDLPSKGRFYKQGHPLCGQTCTEILHMRGKEEDIIANRDYIRRDIVLDKLLSSILCDPSLKDERFFNDILIVDQASLILQARISAYTWEYPVTLTCPKCREVVKFSFDLRKSKIVDPNFESEPNVKYLEDENLFEITIPDTTIVVKVKPLTIGVQRKFKNKFLSKKKKEISTKEKYEDILVSINGLNDIRIYDQFFNSIPSFYLKWFEVIIEDINPKLSLEQQFECENCGYLEDLEPPFSTDFLFTPKLTKDSLKKLKTHSGQG